MGLFEWAALIGAAAWLPQIGVLIYRYAVRPVVHIIPVRESELTYNARGPVFNVRAALVVEKKNAVIVEMTASFRHESGRHIDLVWESFVEKFSELTTKDGDRGEFARDQIATVLTASTTVPTERFFRFSDPSFRKRQREASAAADDLLNRIDQDDAQAVDQFLRSRQFTDLVSLYHNAFPWEPGEYVVEFGLRLLGVKKPYVAQTNLHLSQDEVDRIRENLPLQEQRLREIVQRVPADDQAFPGRWASPELTSSNMKLQLKGR